MENKEDWKIRREYNRELKKQQEKFLEELEPVEMTDMKIEEYVEDLK